MADQRRGGIAWWDRLIRRLTPWWALRWIDHHFDTCWLALVVWKNLDGNWPLRPRPSCFNYDHPESYHRYDYCGKYGKWGDQRYHAQLDAALRRCGRAGA